MKRNISSLLTPALSKEVRALAPAEMGAEHTPSPQAFTDDRSLGNCKMADHLANERTFLAWIRTALAVVAFGSVLGHRRMLTPLLPDHFFFRSSSLLFMGGLTLLGMGLMVIALCNFLNLRNVIEQGQFQPKMRHAILLTIVSCTMAGMVVLYLLAS